jgi:hypothetical protein
VPAATDDKPQLVLAGEVDGGHDVGAVLCGDRKDALLERPGVDPPGRLGQRDLVADVIGVLQLAEQCTAGFADRRLPASLKRRLHRDQPAADALP